ncbi:glycosyltransferase family 4 protein [bacterium]|nr:glycosyltransferase family 4 protein [bacterium]
MKRIAIIHAEPYPEESRLKKETEALVSCGYHVFIFCMHRKSEALKEVIQDNLEIVRYSIYDNPIIRKLDTLLFSFSYNRPFLKRALDKFIEKKNIEVLHVVNLPLAEICLESARKHNIPVVLDFYENYPYAIQTWRERTKFLDFIKKPFKGLDRWLRYEARTVRDFDATLVDSVEFRERLISLGLPESKIHVVQNTIDIDRFDPPDPAFAEKYKDKFVILYLGVVSLDKGISIALEAFPRILKEIPNAILMVVGAGFQRDIHELKLRAKELGVENNTLIMDRVPHKEIFTILSAGDLALLHLRDNVNYNASSPHKLFEYMAAGLPIICSPSESVARIVCEIGCGVVVGFDPRDFASAVIELAKNNEKRKAMGIAGKNVVREKYNWSVDAKVLSNVYKDIS